LRRHLQLVSNPRRSSRRTVLVQTFRAAAAWSMSYMSGSGREVAGAELLVWPLWFSFIFMFVLCLFFVAVIGDAPVFADLLSEDTGVVADLSGVVAEASNGPIKGWNSGDSTRSFFNILGHGNTTQKPGFDEHCRLVGG